jgi:hypothetical protein
VMPWLVPCYESGVSARHCVRRKGSCFAPSLLYRKEPALWVMNQLIEYLRIRPMICTFAGCFLLMKAPSVLIALHADFHVKPPPAGPTEQVERRFGERSGPQPPEDGGTRFGRERHHGCGRPKQHSEGARVSQPGWSCVSSTQT